MSWRNIRRRLERLENFVVTVDPNETALSRSIRLAGSWGDWLRICESGPDTEQEWEAMEALAEWQRYADANSDPPDCIERKLSRMIAKVNGEPDPYGSDGLSEVERRAWDWADYREKQRRHEELAQVDSQPPNSVGRRVMGEGHG
jgi:hypothetical protein